ncbi:MAG: Rpn family recombination-promoting nuclease/putative transposase [Bacteroidales bacterium]|nr:Rpn family recombination-promoting nuclease/putative transposase [Bacteroidales bacterium]
MKTNNKFKASVFSSLFSDPDILRELYCALEGVTLPNDVPVVINTLEDVLFMDRINDISFEIGGKLVVLIEHQSSINPNITLRLLMYIARIYEKIISDQNIYSEKHLPIPRPEFFVLYNGKNPYDNEAILKLSDSFESLASLGLTEKDSPSLELVVKVYNINEGKNREIAGKCKTLAQYSAFIAKVRDFEKEGYSRQEAVKNAIYYCRDHDILKTYLEKHSSEVQNMLMTEWNWDDALAVRYEEGIEKGIEKGEKKGEQKIINLLRSGKSPEEIVKDYDG